MVILASYEGGYDDLRPYADEGNPSHPSLRGLEPLPTIIFSKNTLSIYLFYNSKIAVQINFLHVCCQKGDIWSLW